MEASYPPDAVEPFAASVSSRPGPAFGIGDECFQTAIPGKYPYNQSCFSLCDEFSRNQVFSGFPALTVYRTDRNRRNSISSPLVTLGRTAVGILEALNPPTAVEPFPPATSSRPGSVCGGGERVFHHAIAALECTIFDPATLQRATCSHPRPVFNSVSSGFRVHNLTIPLSSTVYTAELDSQPGRILESPMGAPGSSSSVAPIPASVLQSRPGPELRFRSGVSQLAFSGKYDTVSDLDRSLPDVISIFSAPLPPNAACISLEAPVIADTVASTTTCRRNCKAIEVVDGISQQTHSDETTVRSNDVLHIYYQNVRGLRTKIDAFFLAVTESDYDIIVLTESWLDDRIHSVQLFGNGFTVFRTDRNRRNSSKTRGGGVLIAVSTRLSCSLDTAPVSEDLEQLWVKVRLSCKTLSVGVIYLPPDRKNDANLIQNHIDSIGAVMANFGTSDLILQFGDYNQSSLFWMTDEHGTVQINQLQSRMSAACCTLLDGMNLLGLSQMSSVTNRNSRSLDLVFGNEVVVSSCAVTEALEPLITIDVDHPALQISLGTLLSTSSMPAFDFSALNFRRADFDALRGGLSLIDWHYLETSPNINDAVDFFCVAMNNVIQVCVPLRKQPTKPAWSNARLRRLRRMKYAALRKYRRYGTGNFKQLFSYASNKYRSYNRFLYNKYVATVQGNLRKNPKQFWSFVNTKRKERGFPTSMLFHNNAVVTDAEKCNAFACHFVSAFNNVAATSGVIEYATRDTPRDIIDCHTPSIREEHVVSAIRSLKLSFSAGPDGIPSVVLKRCAEMLIRPLTRLFNLSLQQSEFPVSWKYSFMFPVYKKGCKNDISNYRGITSLCACSKVFEIIINKHLFACCSNYISRDQHGFFPKRSVSTNLVEFTSLCIRGLDSGAQVDTVYTDLKAAFDRVDHDILLQRLLKLGMSASFIAWLGSYLKDRTMRVKIGASLSEPFSNRSGVPQGSNLGPLLFSLFVNEVSSLLPPGSRSFYADDVKIYKLIRSIQDCQTLQRLLDLFADWCLKNRLTLSIGKCCVISFHRKQKPIVFNYTCSGQVLTRVEHVRDLGIHLDQQLSFRLHYDDIITKANRQLGFIFKIANEFRDPLCLRSLYCSLVRSILETNVVVWCPFHANWIARIESIQRKFTRYALRNAPWSYPPHLMGYEARCWILGLDTLANRRSAAQSVFAAKVLMGLIDSPAILEQLNLYAPERPMRQRRFFYLSASNREYGLHDPIRFMMTSFNDNYYLFDFNVTPAAFQRHILASNRRLNF